MVHGDDLVLEMALSENRGISTISCLHGENEDDPLEYGLANFQTHPDG